MLKSSHVFQILILLISSAAHSAENNSAIYSTANNFISVTSGFQVGHNNEVRSSQGNATTLFNVLQIGPKSFARVDQIGVNNNAYIHQISISTSHAIGSDF